MYWRGSVTVGGVKKNLFKYDGATTQLRYTQLAKLFLVSLMYRALFELKKLVIS